MCGLAGYFSEKKIRQDDKLLDRMIAKIAYRGPDNKSVFVENHVGLAHVRLSIIDLEKGNQPISNADNSLFIVFTGEIFNYLELRDFLGKKNYTFSTNTDTEVIVYMYEEYGPDCLQFLNGQFAIALFDKRNNSIFLARDRFGIRPLFYTWKDDVLYFASEIKSLLEVPGIEAAIESKHLLESFTFWSTLPGNTIFKNISSIKPGCFLQVGNNKKIYGNYWEWEHEKSSLTICDFDSVKKNINEMLSDSVEYQLRSDVPVGCYVSGGIDSAIIYNLAKNHSNQEISTFSLTFDEKNLDEKRFQDLVIGDNIKNHHEIHCRTEDVYKYFPEVVSHLETTVLRSAPAPLYLLAKHVRENNIKVVLTGEGADEVFYGYDVFKECRIREFYKSKRNFQSARLLISSIYPYIKELSDRSASFSCHYFLDELTDVAGTYFAHLTRWKNSAGLLKFLNREITDVNEGWTAIKAINQHLPDNIGELSNLQSGQIIEGLTLLSGYILNSQGDRVSMAHGVEGRYPFLDHELVKYASSLPDNYKLQGLKEKHILKESMMDLVPKEIVSRKKQPYRAPDIESFISSKKNDYVGYLFSPSRLKETDLFDPKKVNRFFKKCCEKGAKSNSENMAFMGILSTLIVEEMFVKKRSLCA